MNSLFVPRQLRLILFLGLILEIESDIFSALVEISGLNPQSDFQSARLSGVDFGGSGLSEFNFDYADLRNVYWDNRLSDPASLRYSMRGMGNDEVRGTDFDDLASKLLSKGLWAERFLPLSCLWITGVRTLKLPNY